MILRGLDTVEDDTSIPTKIKEPVLRDFYQNLEVDGWHFDGNRPEEKDRDLLVDFKYVVEEFKKQKPAYKEVISDICKKMGNGMADFILKADRGEGIVTVADYDLYCFYVAGLVGEGLTRMFVESTYGNPALLKRPHLHKSMGLFLQKTNIIRDVREDSDDQRFFWPEEIWQKHVDKWDDLFKPEHKQAALECQSEMIYNALCHADECLFYLAGLKEQSVFNFCAIPQSMAIATLALCFQNYAMFERNIKISKGQACQLMLESTQNLNMVCDNFRKYVHIIRKKNNPRDPCFLKISIQCGKIEQFIESVFPSQTAEDARARQAAALSEKDQALKEKRDAMAYEARWDTIWIGIAVFGTMFAIMGLMVRNSSLSVPLNSFRSRDHILICDQTVWRSLAHGCKVGLCRDHEESQESWSESSRHGPSTAGSNASQLRPGSRRVMKRRVPDLG